MSDPTITLPPQLSDRYRIERELGAGGMATVYLAEDTRHRRKVAVKVLHPELSAVIGGDRFLKEIELTASLQHPHILPLFDSGSADGLLFYVMPYAGNETLRTRLQRENQLPVPEAIRIASEVGDALDYAHRRGVVHRDVKPENILLQDGRAVVADFGIALALQHASGTRMTQTGMSLGTPHYMAPEQAMGDRSVDHRADIYALSAVTYEMLTGEPPFTGPTPQQILAKVVTTEPVPAHELRKTIPHHVSAALATGLQKLPADRQPSAGQFVAEVTGASPTSAMARTTIASARRSGWNRFLPAAAAVLVTIGALGGWMARATPQAGRLPVQFVHYTDSTHFIATGCCGYQIAISPDERQIVYVGSHGGVLQLYSRDLNELSTHPIPGTEGAVEVVFSPDGRWLAFRTRPTSAAVSAGGGDYELKKVPSRGGSPVTIARVGGWPYGAAWLPDDRIVFAGDSTLYSVSADGGTPVVIGSPDSTYRFPSHVAGTNSLLISRFTAERRPSGSGQAIALIDLGTGAETHVTEGGRAVFSSSGHLTFGRGAALVTQRFDPRRGRLLGSPTTITTEISRAIDFDVSSHGVLVFQSGRGGGAMDLVEDGQGRHIPIPIEATHYDNPRVSPDGRRVAFAVGTSPGHQIVVHDLDRRTNLRLTFAGSNREYLAWTADGRLVYAADSAVMIQPADRSAPERTVVTISDRRIGQVAVAGQWLAFTVRSATRDLDSDIYLARLDSPDPKPYLQTPFSEFAPALSPNGRWLAYVSDESGRPEVYASSFPVAGAREVVSSNGGAEPIWGRDGKTLYYRTQDGTVHAVTITGDATPQVVGRQVVFHSSHDISEDAADYDVFPDGRRFIMLRSTRLGAPLVVMTDAFHRMNQLAP